MSTRNDGVRAAKQFMVQDGCLICKSKIDITLHHIEEKRLWRGKRAGFYRGSISACAHELAKCIPLCYSCHRAIHIHNMSVEQLMRQRRHYTRLKHKPVEVHRYSVDTLRDIIFDVVRRGLALRPEYV